MKKCTKCKQQLPLSAFVLRDGKPLPSGAGLAASWCRECVNRQRRERYERNGARLCDMFVNLRSQAKRHKLPWDLTLESFSKLKTSPCIYGIFGSAQTSDIRIGIDRRIPQHGYTQSNCYPCCARHNMMKGDWFTHDEMTVVLLNIPSATRCGNMAVGRKRLSSHLSARAAQSSRA